MKIYLVGGAVRDQLLGLPVNEQDWVVVGATPEQLIQQGFLPVGRHFPVFLHPKTHEEYALARTERKTGPGYTGFSCYFSPEVSLEEDLKRRDFTINAMAQDADGHIIDPYKGQHDLKNHILRHVSSAFDEDPLRILRAARFCAQLPEFQLHESTLALIAMMTQQHRLNELPGERIVHEMLRALGFDHAEKFLHILEQCGALQQLLPGFYLSEATIALLHKVIAHSQHLDHKQKKVLRLAFVLHTIESSADRQAIFKRYRLSRQQRELTKLMHDHHQSWQQLSLTHASEILKFLKQHDALRRPKRFALVLVAYQAFPHIKHTNAQCLKVINTALEAAQRVRMTPQTGVAGKQIAQQLEDNRLEAIEHALYRLNA